MGAEELHDIQLLHRYKTISTGFTFRVQPLLEKSMQPLCNISPLSVQF